MAKKNARSKRKPAKGGSFEDTTMDVVKFGAKAVVAAGVIGALGNAMNNMNK